MDSATGASQGRYGQSGNPPLRLAALMRTIEEQFVQQFDRIAFHQDDANNDYRVRERRLSTLMLDKTVSDEKHLEYAQAIITLADTYKQGFIRVLQTLNSEIEQELRAVQQILATASERTTADVERWLRLSRELQETRAMATSGIIQQTEFDTYIPRIVVQNSGRCEMTLSAEETEQFKAGLAYAAVIKTAYENDQRIQQERKPLTRLLLPAEEEVKAPTQSAVTPQLPAKSIHPLEGKAWFRFLKVAYIALWIVGLGLSGILAAAGNDFSIFLVGAIIVVIVLFGLKKVFYYVILGRTTAVEQPGKGFLDLEDLRNEFGPFQASNPDLFREVVAPFLDSWKEQYGRRVPVQAVDLLQQRIEHEKSTVKEKKQQIIDKVAREGATIEISKLRENFERRKAEFKGPDRQQQIRWLDGFLMSLEAKYGTAIPIDEASKLLDKLEEDIRAEEK